MSTPTARPDPVTAFALNTPLFNKLAGKRVVLASSSPRRREILASVVSHRPRLRRPRQSAYVEPMLTSFGSSTLQGLIPEIVPSTFEENLPKSDFIGEGVYEYPIQTGSRKVRDVQH